MATHVVGAAAAGQSQQATSYTRFASVCAFLTGIASFCYALAFIVLRRSVLSALCLLLFGLLSTVVLVAVYQRIRQTDESFALWALVLGVVGSIGAAVHGGYDLANALNPPPASPPNLPNPVDPRGLLTFGVAGIALLVVAWLMRRGAHFPRALSYIGMASAVLLIILYLGRLIVLQTSSLIIQVPAVANGFLLSPAWYIWLGLVFWRERAE
ncbi:MAG TPA: hypothetical protein VNL77_22070 [Roseiflexaceae bacterium]|nr:hypothetical protein [Roseiflexaceae bacterium]